MDVVLLAPTSGYIGDVIVRACRRFWPGGECVFQDAQEHATRPLSDRWVWTVGVTRNEFSVYRDAAAAASWRKKGGVKSNANTMFHFIVGGEPVRGDLVEIAMIFDKLTPDVRAFIKELQHALVPPGRLMMLRRAA